MQSRWPGHGAAKASPVKKFRDKNKSPAEPGSRGLLLIDGLFRELRDLMREPRNLSACIVLVNDLALRRPHEFRLGARHRLQGCITIAALDPLFDGSHGAAHLGAAGFVDDGAAGNLARRLLGGSRIGHFLNRPSTVPIAGGRERADGSPDRR